MIRVVLAAVRDAELATGCLRVGDHLLASGDGDFHRLFAEDVFAGFEGGGGLLGVEGVGG